MDMRSNLLAARPARAGRFASLALIGMSLVVLGGCGRVGQPAPTERGTPSADRGGEARVSERCLAGRWIGAYEAKEEKDWSAVEVADRTTCFELAADQTTPLGVDTASAFTFATTDDLSLQAVEQLLRVEPAIPFRVEPAKTSWQAVGIAHAAAGATYRIVPTEPLAEGTLYRFALLDQPDGLPVQEWSFETARPVKIVHTLPGDEATNVPVDTGIELVFSHDGVRAEDVEERFEIQPPVRGRFEAHKRTVVFVPEKLEPGTIYRVTVQAGVPVAAGAATMSEPYRFAFETATLEAQSEETQLAWTRDFWDEPTSEAPVLSLSAYGSEPDALAGETVKLTVSRFPSLEAFADSVGEYTALPDWSWNARREFRPSSSGLATVSTFDASLEPLGESQQYLVRFPEPLPAGQYLVRLTHGTAEQYAWLQLSDVGAYVALSEPRLVVWVNEVTTGQPLAGARVALLGGEVIGTTDGDGLLAVATPSGLIHSQSTPWGFVEKSTTASLLVEHRGRELLVALAAVGGQPDSGMGPYASADERHRYWRYVYADRPLYHPTDVVRFWGFVRPRDGAPPVDRLTVRIAGGDYRGYGYESLPIAQTVLTPNEAGTFLGELVLKGATPGYYSLEVRTGDVLLASTALEVRDFVKPPYKIDVEADSRAVFLGDPVSVTVTASFFDGQPVPGLDLVVSAYGADAQAVKTDEAGRAQLVVVAPEELASEALYLGYAWFGITARPAKEEESEIAGTVQVQAFPARLTASGEGTIDDAGRAVIEGSVHAVDLRRLNEEATADFDDFLGAASAGREVTARVSEYRYVKVKTGQHYDFVSKRVVDTYRFDQVEQPMGPYRATSEADGTYRLEFATRSDAYYEVIVSVRDDAGRAAERRVFLGRPYVPVESGRLVLRLDKDEPYDLGEQVVARLSTESDEPVPSGRYLFLRARNGILDETVLDKPEFTFTFAAEHVPNVALLGVVFTGRTFIQAEWTVSAVLNNASRELAVELKPDRERYGPGDTVRLAVRTRNAKGDPAPARVLVAAVDEAIFRVLGPEAGSYLNILGNLYAPAPAGLVRSYGSHQLPVALAAGAERGGGGGERADFRDVALFQEVVTGADGSRETTFELPDNLTAWRVTAQAITADLEAGSGMVSIPVGLPLFVLATMSDEYVAGEQPVLSLRAYGDALAEGQEVSFRVTVPSLVESPIEVTGLAYQSVEVPLPALEVGRYELKVTASAGERSDTLVRPFRVLPSRWVRVASQVDVVEAGATYQVAERPAGRVTLTLSDANRGRYAGFLEELAWSGGDRLDQRLARYLALEMRSQYFGSENEAGDFTLAPYQVSSGGLALFPYGDADLDLTVRALLAAPNLFGREAAIGYLAEVARDPDVTRERAITALLGLATLSQPVLQDLNALAQNLELQTDRTTLSPWERLDLATALAVAGEQGWAFDMYRDLVQEFGQARGGAVRLKVGVDNDDILMATTRAALLGALLGDRTSLALFAYSLQNASREDLVLLEQVGFLRIALPRLPSDELRFRYYRFGERQTVTLEAGDRFELSLSPEELDSLDLQVESGAAAVTRVALVAVDLAAAPVDEDIAVEREYVVNGRPMGGTEPLRLGLEDDVLVRLRWRLGEKIVDGCYQVSDLVPSGLRPITAQVSPYAYTEGSDILLPYAIEGQRVSFCVWRDSKQIPTYGVRPVSKGLYLAEPASIQAQAAPESWNHTTARRIEIR